MAREMKYSGVEWIGEIPKEWEIVKLNRIKDRGSDYAIGDGDHGQIKPEQYIDEGIPYIRVQNLDWGKNIIMKNMVYISEEVNNKNKKSILRPRDILVAKTGATIGKTAIIPDDMQVANTTSSVGKITVDKNYDYRYIFYNISSDICRHQMWIKAMQKSAQPGFNIEDLVEFKIIIPSLFEQKKIADFLDEKIKEIDNAIEKTKETIEEYKKYKQAVITEAVTRGIKSGVEMKKTDNVHINEIPKNWSMKKIKYIFRIKKDIAGKEGFDVLSITQKGIKVKDITTNEGQIAANYSNYQIVEIGDFAMNHMDLLTGWIDVSKYYGVTSPDYRVFNFIDDEMYSREYYLYLMQMCYMNKIFYGLGQGVSNLGRWRLQADKFLNFTVPVPTFDEQKEIVCFLNEQCLEIDNLITNKEVLLTELENYKKSLIYEYVTGKKEVI